MYKPTIGLEIHIELATKSKMFCSCQNDPDVQTPNVNICPVCTAQPGSLPVINEEAVRKVIKTGLALNCQIQRETFFERKNYFYPDLPKGYQISQYSAPIGRGGYLEISGKKIRIERIHLEEDTGKLIHPEEKDCSLIDFNRAGIPLMELVTEPDIECASQAREFIRELQLTLRYLGVTEANMEKGEMRAEVNVSIRPNDKRIKTNDKRIVLKEESYRLMSLLFEIHNKLGPIYKEKNYQDAVEEILKRERILYEREKRITLKLENLTLSDFFVDFVIDNKILLEVKAEKFITQNNIRQTLRYIKSTNLPLGIIVNFRRDKLEYKRLINPLFDFNSLSFVENLGELGTKVEIKNLNSLRAVEKGIEYEIKRQSNILDAREKVIQETRGWDEKKEKTLSQREKEEAHDYCYFPEPDLPPLEISDEFLQEIKIEIPELPSQRKKRFKKEYGLSDKEIELYVFQKDLGDYFEKVISELTNWVKEKKFKKEISRDEFKKLVKISSNYISTDLQGLLAGKSVVDKNFLITPENFAEFVSMIYLKEISSKIAKTLLGEMFRTGKDPSQIIEEKELKQITDSQELEKITQEIIQKNPQPVEDYRQGKEAALQFLVGQIMRETKGKASPEIINKILKKLL